MTKLIVNSFDKLYTTYFKKSYTFVKSYVLDDLEAEDIASESLIKLWEKMKKEPLSDDEVIPYLLTILKNKSLDYLKHLEVKRSAFENIDDWQRLDLDIRIDSLESLEVNNIYIEEMYAILNNTLNSLPVATQKIFRMSRFEHKKNKEIAIEMGISVKGVEFHISKALKVLRITFKDYFPFVIFFL